MTALEWAGRKYPTVPRVLAAHEHGPGKPPAGIELVNAWKYLLE